MDDHAGKPARHDESVEELERLVEDPGRWAALDPDKLRHLLFFQALSYGLEPDEERIPVLMSLHALAVERLPAGARRQVVLHLARALERVHRQHEVREGAGCTNALLPFLLEDPDPSVVSSAVVELSLLLPLENGDALTGPRYAHSLIGQVASEDAKAGILAGLLQLGDARLAPVVARGWRQLGPEGRQTLALLIQAFRGVQPLVVDFLLGWLEDEAHDARGAAFGVVAATLARAGRHAAEHGLTEWRRVFPVTDAPESQPLEDVRELSLEAFAPGIEARLARIADAESPPVLMPHVLSYWGFERAAFGLAVRGAAEAAAPTADAATGSCVPTRVELVAPWPDGGDQETVIEWGVFNPLGPSVNTLRLTSAGPRVALVHTLYHPSASAAHVLALLGAGSGAEQVVAAAGRIMAANGAGGVWLLRSLPDYVHLPAGSPIAGRDAAHLVAAARRSAILAGEDPVSLHRHAERNVRLATDPWGTARRELQEASRAGERSSGGAERLPVAAGPGARPLREADEGDYAAWLAVAAAPPQVAAVRAAILEAWRRTLAAGQPETDR